ncbi:MXAN_6230/SCO0854 family RING domain-containing protein [Streptomyces uncialis]|uniref:RING-type domain-containing protein n=1 Tax=Streptomyces uncialis TaxID=1048205 RepID=A0A1Q4V546_9ACTN|nr:MXAN_6230/SCO0854 family RING domain-containing protein [Streptomyces uncialis]OKH92850.1 hypothetical protein AB852_20180 [Streptomyces uncialis]
MTTLSFVLLRRLRTVQVATTGSRPGRPSEDLPLVALEAELLERGHVLTAPLRAALAALDRRGLRRQGMALLRDLDRLTGADRTHTPLFRGFPHSVPKNTHELYVRRVFALLLQTPEQPCVLCGTTGVVHPVAPCAHLVCRSCWDGADYSGCPLCHRRIDPADPFLRPTAPTTPADGPPPAPVKGPLQPLALATDPAADSARALGRLLGRRTPLSPEDREDLAVLLAHAPTTPDWLPEDIPVRETKALVLGTLLREPATRDAVRPLLAARLTTATDVLRLLHVWSGGGADLGEVTPRVRLRTLPRPLRRELLAALDALPTRALVEDMSRHPSGWKRAAELLHPYERHERHPRAALACAVLRGTELTDDALGAALRRTASEHPDAVRVEGTRVRARTWGARLEDALRARDTRTAVGLLARRPGELVRRLDHLLRLTSDDPKAADRVADVLRETLPKAGTGPLLSAYGQLRARHLPAGRRVFLPRGRVTRSYSTDDTRTPLPEAVTTRACALLETELLRRLSAASRVDLAVLDTDLADLAVPSAERAAARSLIRVPRGSTRPLPDGQIVRLFLHWTQDGHKAVDLDLSVAFYDARWEYLGLCDYTRLRFRDAATHSGDLTSAPRPNGSSEYVDLDPVALGAAGVRYAVPVVFAYDNTPFDELADAFAGFMALPRVGRDARFDPRAVRQRFDLAGSSRILLPMLVDLERRTCLWTDVHLPASEGYHSVERHRWDLGRIGRDLTESFGRGRTTLWDLAVWHAAARAEQVAVIHRDPRPEGTDELWHYRRQAGETVTAFAARIRDVGTPQRRLPSKDVDKLAAAHARGKRVLCALVRGDLAPDDVTGEVYRLLPGPVDGCGLEQLAAQDLVAALR